MCHGLIVNMALYTISSLKNNEVGVFYILYCKNSMVPVQAYEYNTMLFFFNVFFLFCTFERFLNTYPYKELHVTSILKKLFQ